MTTQFKIDPVLHNNILNQLNRFGLAARSFFVGGAVRDNLVNLPVNDFDIAIERLTADEAIQLENAWELTGQDFPVFRFNVFDSCDNLHSIEVAAARLERSTGPGHSDFHVVFGENVTIADDLLRRDLTINSMAVPVTDLSTLIDLHGGRRDLDQRILRHTSSAFVEDPLRVFRVARFLAHKFNNFEVAPETVDVCRELSAITSFLDAERVNAELTKVLVSASHPSVFFEFLKDTDNLRVWFPELAAMVNVPQPAKFHGDNDVFAHTMETLDNARSFTNDVHILLGALFHDVGKILTPTHKLPAHHNHDEAGVQLVQGIADRLRLSNRSKTCVEAAVKCHMKVALVSEMRPKSIIKLVAELKRRNVFHETLAVAHADRLRNSGLSFDDQRALYVAFVVLSEPLPVDVVAKLRTLNGEQCKNVVHAFRVSQFKRVRHQ